MLVDKSSILSLINTNVVFQCLRHHLERFSLRVFYRKLAHCY